MKYIGYYETEGNRRNIFLAATNKMNYIAAALSRICDRVDIVSCSMNADKSLPEETVKINDKTSIHFFKSIVNTSNKIKRIYGLIKRNIILFNYCIKNIKKNEQIIVYHSLGLMRCIYWAKKIKRFQLILEVEEFYNDVYLKSHISKRMEKKFIGCADKYIFPTELLNKKFNSSNKPYIVVHGTYQIEAERKISFQDDKIHIVYAGTFDPRKGGAVAAALAAEWLPENYHIHILGFGSKEEVKNIKETIKETNKNSKARVTYEGVLTGEDYIEFLQKCHIGLSTQNPDADFNLTSFPSKILSYMANGLRVVTIRIPAIETSAVGQDVYYYDKQTPESIAEAILNVNFCDNYDGRKEIEKLNKIFITDLKKILGEI